MARVYCRNHQTEDLFVCAKREVDRFGMPFHVDRRRRRLGDHSTVDGRAGAGAGAGSVTCDV